MDYLLDADVASVANVCARTVVRDVGRGLLTCSVIAGSQN